MGQLEVITPSDVEIRDAVAGAIDAVHTAMAHVEFAIKAIIKAGLKLRAKRDAAEHGEWMKWVEDNVTKPKDVSYQTVRNWIKLAEFASIRGKDLESAQSVRQAYILAGLLPEPECQGGGGSSTGNYLVHMTRLERTIKSQVDTLPLKQWGAEDRAILKRRLRWFVELYEQLDAA